MTIQKGRTLLVLSITNRFDMDYYNSCSLCFNRYRVSIEQLEVIKEAFEHSINNIIIECPVCHSINFVSPQELLEKGMTTSILCDSHDNMVCLCPCTACIGIVTMDDGIYGCSSCGQEWETKDKLNTDIRQIISQYPHRSLAYQILDNENIGYIDPAILPHGYFSKIQEESG